MSLAKRSCAVWGLDVFVKISIFLVMNRVEGIVFLNIVLLFVVCLPSILF